MTAALVTYVALMVPTERIRRFEKQPREYFDPNEIAARAESMRVVGQQTPITVEAIDGDPKHDYELIDGESRWRSAQVAGIEQMLVLVRSVKFGSLKEKHLASLVANFNRSEHTPMEISNALALQASNGMSQSDIAVAIGKDPNWVSQYLSLQKLHPEVKKLLDPRILFRERLPVTAAARLAAAPMDKQLDVIAKARRSNGQLTLSRISEVLLNLEGIKRRKNSPAKHRVMIESALRSIGIAAAKVATVSAAEAAEIFKRLKASGDITGIDSVEQLMEVLNTATEEVSARAHFPDLPCVYDGTETPEGLAQLNLLHEYWLKKVVPEASPPKTYLEIAYPRDIAYPQTLDNRPAVSQPKIHKGWQR